MNDKILQKYDTLLTKYLTTFLLILIVVLILGGCQKYHTFDSVHKRSMSDNGVSEEMICKIISSDSNSWIKETNKCKSEKDFNFILVNSAILFSILCSSEGGSIEILEQKTICSVNNIRIYFIDGFDKKFKEYKNYKLKLIDLNHDVKTIKELCYIVDGKYNTNDRTCGSINNPELQSVYLILEKVILPKDRIVVKKEEENSKNIQLWTKEAKEWKGTLDELCEQITNLRNTFDKNTLSCTYYGNKKIDKYEIMKPLLLEQHQRIVQEREKNTVKLAKEAEEKNAEKLRIWENRVGKSAHIKSGKSYICESYININPLYGIYIPKIINLDVGYSSIEIQNYMTFKYIDSFEDYELYKGYTQDYKMYKLQVNKSKKLQTTPYSFYLEGIGYYCENK